MKPPGATRTTAPFDGTTESIPTNTTKEYLP
jgi:hypothetical protein